MSSLSIFGSQSLAFSRTPSSGWETAMRAGKSPAFRSASLARSSLPAVESQVRASSDPPSSARTSASVASARAMLSSQQALDARASEGGVVRPAGARRRTAEPDDDGIDVERGERDPRARRLGRRDHGVGPAECPGARASLAAALRLHTRRGSRARGARAGEGPSSARRMPKSAGLGQPCRFWLGAWLSTLETRPRPAFEPRSCCPPRRGRCALDVDAWISRRRARHEPAAEPEWQIMPTKLVCRSQRNSGGARA